MKVKQILSILFETFSYTKWAGWAFC
jgi:hypothetical protein